MCFKCDSYLLELESHHPALELIVCDDTRKNNKVTHMDFKNVNFDYINAAFDVNWDENFIR